MTTEGLRKPEKALTAQFVKTACEPGKRFDGHGLFLRMQPNGARPWVQRIVIRGKRYELGLGNPALVSLAEARDAALKNRKLAQSGGDPIRAKRESDAVLSLRIALLGRPRISRFRLITNGICAKGSFDGRTSHLQKKASFSTRA